MSGFHVTVLTSASLPFMGGGRVREQRKGSGVTAFETEGRGK